MGAAETAQNAFLVLAVVLAAGVFVAAFARAISVPDVALFLLAGIALGPSGLALVTVPADSAFNQFVLLLGANWLLFVGGTELRFSVLKQLWITIVVISTLGVLITAGVTAVAGQWLLGLPLLLVLLLGVVLAPTDPATLAPIFSQVKIRERVAQTVISESAFNGATGAVLTFTLLGVVMGSAEPTPASVTLDFLREAGIGIAVGGLLGYLVADLVAHERRGILADFAPITAVVGVAGSYAGASALDGSGFMAVFVFGLAFGNRAALGVKFSGRAALHLDEFKHTCTLILRLMILTLLGSQVNFGLMAQVAIPAVILVLVFMFVARPLAVFICAAPDRRARWSWQELVFMCWTRETGVIPAALAGLLLGQGVPHADVIAAVTFVAILMTSLIQAPTSRALARRLSLTDAVRAAPTPA
jgi:cell volume regulation protein A